MEEMKVLASRVLKEALAQGADEAAVVLNESEKREFNVEGGAFTLMRTLVDRTLSVSVYKDHRKGTVSLNRFDDEALQEAVRGAMAGCLSAQPDPDWEMNREADHRIFSEGTVDCDLDMLFMRSEELLRNVRERYPSILIEQMITDHVCGKEVYMNTHGVTYEENAGWYAFSLMYSAHEGEKGTSFFSSDVTLTDLSRPVIECGMIDKELSDVVRQLDAKPYAGKTEGTVILLPGAMASLVLGTVMGFISSGSLIDGTSIWKNALGEQVADERLTFSLKPHDPRIVCGQQFTSEGYLTEDWDVIQKGRLMGFALSQYAANKTGGKRAGNQTSSVIVEAGAESLEDIIGRTRHGILVGRFSGGQPTPAGDFSGVAKNSFLIEDGRISGALTETMISGNVARMLRNIEGISREVLEDGGGSLPSIAFGGVTISGKA